MESQVPTRSSTARAWMQLFRPPNLLTVPGDPLAGFLLARLAVGGMPVMSAWPCILASLLLYMAGLLSNDYFDLEEDKKERPDRPLPSGAVNPRAALTVAVILAVLGVGTAFMAGPAPAIVAAVLVCAIALYNIWMKKVEILGPAVMGICRGLSIMLGAAVFGTEGIFCTMVLIAAAGIAFYVSAVTAIAAHETHGVEIGGSRWRPLINLVMCLFFIMFSVERLAPSKLTPRANPLEFYMMAVAAVMALFWALYCGRQLEGEPEPAVVSRTIGGFLRGLLFVQAAFAALAGGRSGLLAAAVLLLLWPLAGMLGRKFYAS